MWCVYILKCKNGSLYTGITNNLERRLEKHRQGKGARYTRSFGVGKIVYNEGSLSKSGALKREAEIKSWTRKKKLTFIIDL